MKLQQEQLKTERKAVSWEQREAEKQRQFELKQQKRDNLKITLILLMHIIKISFLNRCQICNMRNHHFIKNNHNLYVYR